MSSTKNENLMQKLNQAFKQDMQQKDYSANETNQSEMKFTQLFYKSYLQGYPGNK